MLNRTRTAVRTWADEIGIPNMLLAELDFCLVHLIEAIVNDAVLRSKLYLKGGTAINKLHSRDLPRLSVDIDLNHIGSKDQVLSEKADVTKRLLEVVRLLDDSYVVKVTKRRYKQTTIGVAYPSIVVSRSQRIKIEISHVERFPILPICRRQLRLPGERETWLTAYQPEELIATKIRALHDRLKGRDVYDLWSASSTLNLDKAIIRKLFLYYFYKSRKVFNPKLFFPRLERAIEENAIEDDVSDFVRTDVDFDLREEAITVLDWLSFLHEVEEEERDFILLARTLLGKGEIPKGKRTEIDSIQYPLRRLFGKDDKITERAYMITTEDIKPFTRKASVAGVHSSDARAEN